MGYKGRAFRAVSTTTGEHASTSTHLSLIEFEMSASDAPTIYIFNASQELDHHRMLKVNNHKAGKQSLTWGNCESGPDPKGWCFDRLREEMASHWASVFHEELAPELYKQLCRYLEHLRGKRTITFGKDIHSLKDKQMAVDLFLREYQADLTSTLTDMISRAQPKSGPKLEFQSGKVPTVTLEYEKCYAPPGLLKDLVCLQFVLRLPVVLKTPKTLGTKGNIDMVCGIYVWKDKPEGTPVRPGTIFSTADSNLSFYTEADSYASGSTGGQPSPPPYIPEQSDYGYAPGGSLSEGSEVFTPASSQATSYKWFEAAFKRQG